MTNDNNFLSTHLRPSDGKVCDYSASISCIKCGWIKEGRPVTAIPETDIDGTDIVEWLDDHAAGGSTSQECREDVCREAARTIRELRAEVERLKNPPSLAKCCPDPWQYNPTGQLWSRWSSSLSSHVALVHGKIKGEKTMWHWTVGHPISMGAVAIGQHRDLQTALDHADEALENADD